jgi:hypothetical protein
LHLPKLLSVVDVVFRPRPREALWQAENRRSILVKVDSAGVLLAETPIFEPNPSEDRNEGLGVEPDPYGLRTNTKPNK